MGHRLNLAFVILALATLMPAQESNAQYPIYGPAPIDGAGFDQGFAQPGYARFAQPGYAGFDQGFGQPGYGVGQPGYGSVSPGYGPGYYPNGRGYSNVSPPWAGSPYRTGPGSLVYSPSYRVYDSGSVTFPNGLGGYDTVRNFGYDTKRRYYGYGGPGAYGAGVASMPGYGTGSTFGPGPAAYPQAAY